MKVLTLHHLLISAVEVTESTLALKTKTETIYFEAGTAEEAETAKEKIIELVR
jgi:hypothetical protein